MSRAKYKSVTRARRCPVCDGDHKCGIGDDGSIQCGRVPDGLRPGGQHNGHVFLGLSDKDPQFGVFRAADDPELKRADEERRREWRSRRRHSKSNGTANGAAHHDADDASDRPRMEANARRYAASLTPQLAADLDDALGLRADVLARLPLLGYSPKGFHDGYKDKPCWTMPETNPAGKITGIVCRYPDGVKKALTGSGRTLVLLQNWDTGAGPVFAVEGHSDTLAGAALSLSIVGRPSNAGGVDHLAWIAHRAI